jgi:hypothetical protein
MNPGDLGYKYIPFPYVLSGACTCMPWNHLANEMLKRGWLEL